MHNGFLYGNLGDGGYQATHRGLPYQGQLAKRVTPNFEKKEGDRFGGFVPASYLPSIRLEPVNYDFFVISAGSPCALDSKGYAVPAGYSILLSKGKNQGPQYSSYDVNAGVANALGAPVQVGEYVVNAMIDAGLSVGKCLGVASYDVFMQLNSDPHNPATYKYHNYNRQNSFSILTKYLLEFPIEPFKRTECKMEFTATEDKTTLDLGSNTVLPKSVKMTVNKDRFVAFTFAKGAGAAGVDQLQALTIKSGDMVVVEFVKEENFYKAPFEGMATWRGEAKPNALVTFNEDSKFCIFEEPVIEGADVAELKASVQEALNKNYNVIGIVTMVDKEFPKQMLDLVTTAFDPRLYTPIVNPETGKIVDDKGLDRMPGSATDGVPHMIQYAGGGLDTGVVTFKLKL